MKDKEYVQIEDENSVFRNIDKLCTFCEDASANTQRVKDLIVEKHQAIGDARRLSKELIQELKDLNRYFGKTTPATRRSKSAPKKVAKKPARKAVKRKSPKKASRKTSSMKRLKSDITRVRKALR